MSRFLVDTNVLSEFSRRGNPAPAVERWLTAADDQTLYASVLTFAEILRGIELLDAGKRRSQLERWFYDELRPSFENSTLPVSDVIASRWATLPARLQRSGRNMAILDGLIAATALDTI